MFTVTFVFFFGDGDVEDSDEYSAENCKEDSDEDCEDDSDEDSRLYPLLLWVFLFTKIHLLQLLFFLALLADGNLLCLLCFLLSSCSQLSFLRTMM